MKNIALKKQLSLIEEKQAQQTERMAPYTVSHINLSNPLNTLAERLLMWEPRDLRYKEATNVEPNLLKDIAAGMETHISRKDPATGFVELTVEFQDNIHEYERYNIVANEHNSQWLLNGAKTQAFNPITGDISKIHDARLDPAVPTSSHNPLADELFDSSSDGPIAQARPSMSRKTYVTVKYHLRHDNRCFTLGYAAYDKNQKVLYYNEVTYDDLAYLIRRSIQEIWGNPIENGRHLQGIPFLINGKKLDQCKANNHRPIFLDHNAQLKDSNPELLTAEITQTGYSIADNLTGYIIPAILIFIMIVHSAQTLIRAFTYGQEGTAGPWLLGMMILMGGLALCRKLSQEAARKASAIDAEKKFI